MTERKTMNRRTMIKTLVAGAACSVVGWTYGQGRVHAADAVVPCDPRVRGPFPILSTPFTETGAVDFEVLAKEARFVDWCGSPGMIWPQSNDSIELLTREEKLKGMEILAETMRGRQTALCLGVQGKNTEEMLVFAKHAEDLKPEVIISRPPDDGKTEEDMRQYWQALAEVVHRPVIIQTSGGSGYKGARPSVKLLVELAKESPFFGYVKEEVPPILPRMQELVAAKPVIKCVYSAKGGFGWLHQSRFGTEGLITERAVYADLLALIWKHMENGDRVAAADAYSRLLLMLNLKETIPGNNLRGFHLYVWKKRGIFKNMLSRHRLPADNGPDKGIVSEMKLTQEIVDEIESRFEVIQPYLREGNFPG
ncbi:MAG: dihydrodipicolinate synthase family protein [Planctomycetia bacterium]|nr:dihydrodipicolinate synthase family protein [Planctomycetia bacterium]